MLGPVVAVSQQVIDLPTTGNPYHELVPYLLQIMPNSATPMRMRMRPYDLLSRLKRCQLRCTVTVCQMLWCLPYFLAPRVDDLEYGGDILTPRHSCSFEAILTISYPMVVIAVFRYKRVIQPINLLWVVQYTTLLRLSKSR